MGSSDTVYFTIDTTPPEITILLPQNQSYGSTDIQLTFTLNEPVAQITYSLDGQEPIGIIGNVTLPALPNGAHHVTIYATDLTENSGSSETVYFEIAPFPTLWVITIITSITIALAAGYLFLKRKQPVT
jgi:hypothetical protein